MTLVKKGIAAAIMSLMLLFGFASLTFAQDASISIEDVASGSYDTDLTLSSVIGSIIQIALGLLGIILLVIIIYSGFEWMTAGGNSDKVESAKTRMINAVIGLILILAAYAIAGFVIEALTTAGLEGISE